jgi:hypothetical protein
MSTSRRLPSDAVLVFAIEIACFCFFLHFTTTEKICEDCTADFSFGLRKTGSDPPPVSMITF